MSEEPEDFSSTSTFSRGKTLTMLLATAAVCAGIIAVMFAE